MYNVCESKINTISHLRRDGAKTEYACLCGLVHLQFHFLHADLMKLIPRNNLIAINSHLPEIPSELHLQLSISPIFSEDKHALVSHDELLPDLACEP
uniref:Uncharacterized protein n=1 Tax=Rhizophora mucronata TaxID=61149 RepID=A0A2P2J252_RHIMU